nr:substrate-binding domain-containing protein [Chenggangzhangella methanolivorans]
MKLLTLTSALALGCSLLAAGAANAQSRDQIRIVGSSTVYPFTTAAAEQFGKGGQFKTPVVESTGTGGGLKLSAPASAPAIRTPRTPRAPSRSPSSKTAPRTA